jgi:hypothetical protein
VLNFGVEGYGVDQTYMRYLRDVAATKPDVVVMDLIRSNLVRTMAVYAFITFPTWDLPFAKPRFDLSDGVLRRINPLIPTPEEIIDVDSIEQLPDIGYDFGYNHSAWRWRPDWSPFLWRFIATYSPRVEHPRVVADERMLREVNMALLRRLALRIANDGAKFLIVYLPPMGTQVAEDSLVMSLLGQSGVPHIDMTGCLSQIPTAELRVPGGHHFSAVASAALARCTADELVELMKQADA